MPYEFDHAKALEWLQLKWKRPMKCPVCREEKWSLADLVVETREFHGGGLLIGASARAIPLLPVTCMYCGNTLFFNALLMGLVKSTENQAATRSETEEARQ